MIYLHKILPALASPIMALLVLAILSVFTKPRWIKAVTLLVFLLAPTPSSQIAPSLGLNAIFDPPRWPRSGRLRPSSS